MSVRWDGRHWATETPKARRRPTGNAPVLHGLRLASMRRFDATIRRGHGELRSAGNYLTVDPPRYLASRPGGGAYEAAAAALARLPPRGERRRLRWRGT